MSSPQSFNLFIERLVLFNLKFKDLKFIFKAQHSSVPAYICPDFPILLLLISGRLLTFGSGVNWSILYATGFSKLEIDLMTYEFSIVPLTVAPDTNVMERLNLCTNRAMSTKVGLLKI